MAEVKGLRINDQIRVREVRLIGVNGEQAGIVPTIEAVKMAAEAGLDLVDVAPTAKPPVCKISLRYTTMILSLNLHILKNFLTAAIK